MNKKSKNKVDNRPPKHLRTLKRGDKRKDGMIFLCYHEHSPNGERWVTPKEFKRQYNRDLERMRSTDNRPPKHLRTLRRGDKRNDGMIFWSYHETAPNGERWIDREKYNIKIKQLNDNYEKQKIKNPHLGRDRNRKRRQDPLQRMIDSQRSRVRQALKLNKKAHCTIDLLGCSPMELREYLESKFEDGMTWENRGLHGWHIDHIKPCASFDLSDPEQQKECFHYTNLQPLWAKDNLSKGSHYNPQTED